MATNGNGIPDWFTIFRTDEDERIWLYEELCEGRLRQGWGAHGLTLKTADGQRVEKTHWEATYKEHWKEDPSPKRFVILARMLEMQDGSAVVLPKMPEWNLFTIARVGGGYRFDTHADRDDYGHIVPIDPDSLRTFGNRADPDAILVSGLFPRANHRAAVSFCENTNIVRAVNRLLQRPSNPTSKPQKYLSQPAIDDAFKAAAEAFRDHVKDWNGPRFEEAVRQAFKDQGYTEIPHKRYDRQGGDADILVSPPANPYSLFLPAEIAVQVKWRQGVDEGDEESIRQIVKWAESQGSHAVKCVISSASEFTPKAKQLAKEHNVMLIGGLKTMCFLLGFADQYRSDWDI